MLVCNSKKVLKGDTFIALKGEKYDGHNFILEAIKNGASKVICEHGNYDVDTVIVQDTKKFLIEYLKLHCPKLKFIGITGTNGKTTTAYLIYKALNMLNIKCAYIGTIGFYLDEKIKDLENTTPSMLELFDLINLAKIKDFEYVVMEVSSHALMQGRCDYISFNYAIFTNLTQDHLDYHKTFNNYALAKQRLFKELCHGKNIINNDSNYAEFFKVGDFVTYGFNKSDYIINYDNEMKINGCKYEMSLIGKHNVYNMSCVIILLKLLEIEEKKIFEIIKELTPPPGRLDVINYKTNKIIIDYAHTPDALENVLKTCINIKHNKLIIIFGCGGNRDKKKRHIMGKIASKWADYFILTNDNPRFENPNMIVKDILSDVEDTNYEIILNRKKAIEKGIQLLQNNDILMVLGKGHEKYQIVKDKKIYLSDYEEIKKYI